MELLPTTETSGVYAIRNRITGEEYIGSTVNFVERIWQHRSKLSLKTHPNKNLQAAWNLYSNEAFDVVVLVSCAPDDLRVYEQIALDNLAPAYNVYTMAYGSSINGTFSLEHKTSIGKAMRKQWDNPEYRAKVIAAHKGKAYNKGYKCTPEQVENRRRAARISNMKRKYGADWKEKYVQGYPEFAGDVDAY